MFSFDREDDRDWVIQNQPWHFDGNLFAIKILTGSEQPSLVHFSSTPFWMRAHDLPLACWSESVIRSIAAWVGPLEAFESPTDLVGTEFVRFDITKPLLRGLKIKLGGKYAVDSFYL